MKQARIEIDWINLGLVAVMVTAATWAIVAADWTEGLTVVWIVSLGGLMAGLALAWSRFPAWVAHSFSLVYYLGWGSWWLTQQIEQGETYRDKLIEIDRRVGVWLWQVTHNEVARDSLIFILLLTILAWWLSYLAVWYSQRFNRVWRVVLPSGLLLFANVYYAGSSLNTYFIVYLLTALLIIARSYTRNQETHWKQSLVGYTLDFGFDLLRAGFILALVATLIGWGAPAAASNEQVVQAWRAIEGPWRSFEENWSRWFSSLRSRQPLYADPFGRFLTLQGPRSVTENPVMDVRTREATYWRAACFNQYTGSGWVASNTRTLAVEEYGRLYGYETVMHHPVTQTITIYRPATTLIFAAPQPQWVSLAVRAEAWTPADLVLDPALIRANRVFAPGDSYIVNSLVSHAPVDILRRAGEDYPDWIKDNFLALPPSLPQRVRDLAQQITADYDNPYDQATALESWLRANITYDDKIAAPPAERDAVDYLLFESQRGYCDYYASAMAVMARAVGLPSRLVVGYATGTLNPTSGAYRVREKDSHSWVEIYFPRYGWIDFEPTSTQLLIQRPTPQPTPTPAGPADPLALTPGAFARPTRPRPEPEEGEGDLGGVSRPTRAQIPLWLTALIFVSGLLLLSLALVLARAGLDSWSLTPTDILLLLVSIPPPRWRLLGGKQEAEMDESRLASGPFSLHHLTPAQRAYTRLMRLNRWLGVVLRRHLTPHERGATLALAVPEGRPAIMAIVDNYVHEQYGRTPISDEASRQAWEAVRGLMWQAGVHLRVERVRRFFKERLAVWRAFGSRFE